MEQFTINIAQSYYYYCFVNGGGYNIKSNIIYY